MMLTAPPRAVGYCVAPTYSHARKQWKEIRYYLPHGVIKSINRAEHLITLIGDREIWFKSADSADSMRGEGLTIVWMDEGGQILEERWTLELRPALMDTKGLAIFTGTPKGKNWYFRLWTRGQDKTQNDYESWAFSTYGNPYIDKNEIEEFKRDMPELAYRQEILAEFVDEVGSVFRNIHKCIHGKLEEYNPERMYYMGVDLAKTQDFTVLTIIDDLGHVCAWDRFSQLDWVFQQSRIINLANKYHAQVIIDSSGVGDPIYDELSRKGLVVIGYKFTSATKKDLIDNLSIRIDNHEVSYPEIPVLINELQLYGYTTSAQGVVHYGAPEGYHDDAVISLALAVWMIIRSGPLDVSFGKAKL